jgi:hypothetical protein
MGSMPKEKVPVLRRVEPSGVAPTQPRPRQSISAHGQPTPAKGGGSSSLQEPEVLENGMLKMPCRARGVPSDHTFATAYFLVKKDTPHGTLLKCCHPFCSEAGWKFRYCMFCKVSCGVLRGGLELKKE